MARNEVTGIAGGSRESFYEAYKDQYLPRLENSINTEANLTGYVRSNKQGSMMGGRRSLSAIQYRNVQSAGQARFENDDLPEPGSPAYENPEIFSRDLYDRVRHTGQSVRAGRGGKSVSWIKPSAESMKSAREQGTLNRNRKAWLGLYEPMATVTQYVHGTGVVTVADGANRTSDSDERWYFNVEKYLREGMEVGFIAPTGGGAVDAGGDPSYSMANGATNSRTIASIDEAAGTFTLNSPAPTDFSSTDVNALVVPYRSRLDSVGSEDSDFDSNFANMNGIANLIATSAEKTFVYALSRSTYAWLNANVINQSGTPTAWTEGRITRGLDRAAENRWNGGKEVTDLFTSRAVRYEHIAETESDRRFTPIQTKRGWGRLVFTANDKMLPFIVDRDCPIGDVLLTSKKCWKYYKESGLSMVGEARFVANKDAEEVVHHESGNIACDALAAQVLIQDITATQA